MIFPETMTRVQIITNKDKVDLLMSSLIEINSFHPDEPKKVLSAQRLDDLKKASSIVQEHLSKIESIIEVAGLQKDIGILNKKIEVESWIELSRITSEEANKIENLFKNQLEEVEKIKAAIREYKQIIEILSPYKGIDINLKELQRFNYLSYIIGYIETQNIDDIKKKLEDLGIIIYKASERKDRKFAILFITHKENEEEVRKILRSFKYSDVELREGFSQNPKEAFNELNRLVEKLEGELNELKAGISKEVLKYKEEITKVYAELLTLKDYIRLLNSARISNYYIQVEGYIPVKELKNLEDKLKENVGDFTLIAKNLSRLDEDETPPTSIKLPRFLKPFESIVELYGTPSYWEIAPSVFLLITFPLFFGLMFPDLGHAIALFVFSIFFYGYGKKRGSQTIKYISLILLYASIISMFTGYVEKGFFGPLLTVGTTIINPNGQLGPLYNLFPDTPLKTLSPTEEVVYAIIITFTIGAIVLFSSTILGTLNSLVKKDYKYLIIYRLPITILYSTPFVLFTYGFLYGFFTQGYFSAVENALGGLLTVVFHTQTSVTPISIAIANYVVYGSIASLMYMFIAGLIYEKREHGHISGQTIAIEFIEKMYEPALLLISNTASFIRILAFAFAHYYVLFAFTIMAYLASGQTLNPIAILINPIGLIIYIFGNLLALALEGLVVFVQDLRLHLYEMFSKFYLGTGRKYSPVMSYIKISFKKA